MFRIGVLEASVACALVALTIIIPLVVIRGHASLNKRLKGIENKLEKKK